MLRLCSPVREQSVIDHPWKVKSLQYAANEVAVCCTSIRPGLVSKPDGFWQLLPPVAAGEFIKHPFSTLCN